MKSIMYILALLIFSVIRTFAQTPTTTYPYLYDNFRDGVVVMSDGGRESKKMNIHLRAGRLHYIDNEIIKEAFLTDVAAVEIGSDVFVPVHASVMKVVAKNGNGLVAVEQLGDFETAISGSGAYGTSASSSATMKLTSVQQDGQVNQNHMNIYNEKSEGMSLRIQSTFYLVTPKYKVKATRSSVEAVIPADKAALLPQYLKEHKVKWKFPQSLLQLVDFLSE